MSYSLERVQKVCKEIAASKGVSITVPIKVNSRLTTTLGRVKYKWVDKYNRDDERVIPTIIEFSKSFLADATDFQVEEVIKHEMAHYLVAVKTGERHGHDKVFKAMCAELGTNNDMTVFKDKIEREFKYSIICPKCGVLGGKSRMCKTLQQIEWCTCKRCGSAGLTYEQNW